MKKVLHRHRWANGKYSVRHRRLPSRKKHLLRLRKDVVRASANFLFTFVSDYEPRFDTWANMIFISNWPPGYTGYEVRRTVHSIHGRTLQRYTALKYYW